MIRRRLAVTMVAVVAAIAGCRGDPAAPDAALAYTVHLISPGGPSGVDPGAPLTFGLGHSMARGMDMEVILHVGNVDGPLVPATVAWSSDRTRVTLTPSGRLAAKTPYTVEFRCLTAAGASVMRESCPHAGSGMSGAMHGGGATVGMHGMTLNFTTA